ncbi:MAG: 4Fe-4S dicluster domain-containing protein [Bacillota bacterium]
MKFVDKNEELCSKCHICEDVCAEVINKSEDRAKSAIKINDGDGQEIINVCNQCGECIDVCSEEAIYRAKTGIVLINKSKCIGCLVCVGYCPSISMRYHQDLVAPYKCIACGKCTAQCPSQAIFLNDTEAKQEAAAAVE